jgi:hypothetical protein
MTTMLDTPTIAPAFTLDVTKVATIADFEGPLHRYYVRNFTLVAKIAV